VRVLLAIALSLSIAACANGLPQAQGPLFQLNPGKWTATTAELAAPPEGGR
jgi:hypothetical protein